MSSPGLGTLFQEGTENNSVVILLISAIFEIYKDNIERYFNSNGRNWRQMYKTYTDKLKAEKEARKK